MYHLHLLAALQIISIHVPPRGATKLRGEACWHTKFQFTPLREGRRYLLLNLWRCLHFNSRPSARGDSTLFSPLCTNLISIHAPPRGATSFPTCGKLKQNLFQFTPLREGRLKRFEQQVKATYFNSRPSARGDPQVLGGGCVLCISIHAPPRGATHNGANVNTSFVFQFTPLREGRRNAYIRICILYISIHAPPRGATHLLEVCPCGKFYFNSRPSARGDEDVEGVLQKAKHFNSRPSARGDGTW